MLRRSSIVLATPSAMLGDVSSKLGFKTGWRDLWGKPETRDERIKEYVPEVIEESLEEQRALLEERTSRDVVVELGHKVLREIENKAPTPSIAPNFNNITKEFGGQDLINQRALSYLLYPTSFKGGRSRSTPHELVENFGENLQSFIEYVESNGSASLDKLAEKQQNESAPQLEEGEKAAVEGETEGEAAANSAVAEEETEDVTLYVKLVAGMSLANVHCNDFKAAVRCIDNGIDHVVDPQRLGGLLGMKAGVLNRMKKYEEAAEVARKAIEVSNNPQGYLQGAAALKLLKREEEVVALLQQGHEALEGGNEAIEAQLESAKKTYKPALEE